MKRNFLSYILLICFIGGVYMFLKQDNYKYEVIRQQGVVDTCIIQTLGGDILCNFEINGKEITKRISKPNKDIKRGERFKVYYQKDFPDKYYFSFAEPVFDKEEYNKCKVLDYKLKSGDLWFKYKISSKEFKRYQVLDKYTKDRIEARLDLTPIVYYSKSNPKLAYLIFE